jgi:hypothetical protein
MPIFWRKRQIFFRDISRAEIPSKKTSPESGGVKKWIHWRSVLFPPPEGPMRTLNSPEFKVRDTLSRTSFPPKDLVRLETINSSVLPLPVIQALFLGKETKDK